VCSQSKEMAATKGNILTPIGIILAKFVIKKGIPSNNIMMV